MNRKELVERGLHQSYRTHWRAPTTMKVSRGRPACRTRELRVFTELTNHCMKKHPIIERYIDSLYAEGKDIMFLYNFYLTSRYKDYHATKTLAEVQYHKENNIRFITMMEHIGLEEEADFSNE